MKKRSNASIQPADIRQTYFKHEGALIAAGQLYYLIALGLLLASLSGIFIRQWHGVLSWPDTFWVAGVFIILAGLYALVGYGFRRLAPWSRYGAGALAMLCLSSVIINPSVQHPLVLSVALIRMFALPIGIVITLYAAYLTLFAKGTMILSSEYRQVIRDTPEVQYTFSKLFLAVGIALVSVQSVKVLMIFTGKLG
ncbi:MAG: hypothetical protein K0R17_769 [Rariglobus sp.]|jgi:hypothetical protein|nr:hypothetical protein [Rariglobus sp.]